MTETVTSGGNLVTRAYGALETFIDPCSQGVGNPISVVRLGLIDQVRVDEAERVVYVDFCPTGPSCFFQISMLQEIEALVSEATGLRCVVEISDEIWTPDRIVSPPDQRRRLPLMPR